MSSVAFFGHRDFDYKPIREKIIELICDLIENHGATEFYNGFRGNFDSLCAEIVFGLKEKYPAIKNIMVLSYHPYDDHPLPKFFDESVYLLDKSVIPKFAISYTNQAIVDRVDFIISSIKHDWGGAWTACEYAKRKKKCILNLFGIKK